MTARSPILLIATGAQEIGKSYTSLTQLIANAYLAKHKRLGLIFDSNNEYGAYEIDGVVHKIKTIPHNEIIKYGNTQIPQVRRIAPFTAAGSPFEPEEVEKLVVRAVKEFRGGTLILEDTNTIFGDTLPVSISSVLCNVRHRNCDVVLHLQSVGRILPKMRQNCKVIRYHYQLDSIADSADKLVGEAEVFYIVEKLVNKQYELGNKYFHVYIWRMIKKVKGAFSPRMFADAIEEYISEHTRTTALLEKKRGPSGKKLYTYEECIKIKTSELFKKYYGN